MAMRETRAGAAERHELRIIHQWRIIRGLGTGFGRGG